MRDNFRQNSKHEHFLCTANISSFYQQITFEALTVKTLNKIDQSFLRSLNLEAIWELFSHTAKIYNKDTPSLC